MSTSGRPAAGAAASPLKPNILVVDAHPSHRALAETVFSEFGCRVTLTDSGEAALAACATQAFDLIILDRQMPAMHGDDLARRLRAQRGASQAAFVVCCSTTPPEDLSAGYDRAVAKPLTASNAAEVLDEALRRLPLMSYLAPILLMDTAEDSTEEGR